MKLEIVKHETEKYWYIWNNETNTQVCDEDGNPIRFTTIEEAKEYKKTFKQRSHKCALL